VERFLVAFGIGAATMLGAEAFADTEAWHPLPTNLI
jgi:hypothetical protein